MSVKLRRKKTAGEKISLYLDIYHNGKRQYDFLKLYLLKGTDSRIKATNKETLELAEMIRAKRQIEFQYSDHDIIPKFKRDADFVEYFKTLGQSKDASSKLWEATLNHLRKFTGGKLAFKNINERWLEKWQNYLLDKVSRNSAHTARKNSKKSSRFSDSEILICSFSRFNSSKERNRSFLLSGSIATPKTLIRK